MKLNFTKRQLLTALLILVTLIFNLRIKGQASAFADSDSCKLRKTCKECSAESLPFVRNEAYCGYIVQYDPCGNCTRIYKHQCKFKGHCICNWNYKKAKADCGFKLVNQVRVGAPVMFYVNNLNFLKYQLDVQRADITFSSGDPGLFAVFNNLITSNAELPLSDFRTKTDTSGEKSLEGTCKFRQDYKKLRDTIFQFTGDMDQLVADFSKIMIEINASTNDCKAGELDGKIKNFLMKVKQIKNLNEIVLDPAQIINQVNRNRFDAFYADAIDIDTNQKKEKACSDLGATIKRDMKNLKLKDSLYMVFGKILGKIYPFPDMEYQYNVPKVRNVDYLVFNINLRGKDSSRNYRLNMKDEQIHVPVKNGVRIDFTTGPFINYFSETIYSLHADTLFSKIKPDSGHIGARIVANERKNLPHFGVSTMLQLYPRQWRSVSFAPALGLGINLNKEFSFLLGGGVVLGREQKLALNGGYSLNYVKTLNTTANNVNEHVNADYSIKTMNVVKEGWFFSLSYNIGLSKETKQASEDADK